MKHEVDAVYENGTFRPLATDRLGLAEGQRVRILVEENSRTSTPESVLDLAAEVYAGLSDDDVSEIERIATDRSTLFSSDEQ